MEYPEEGEYVVATIKRIYPYGVLCTLDEYREMEGFIHISQVSSGWVRNIRNFVKEGQKVVAKVKGLNKQRNSVDLTIAGVSEIEKKKKMKSFQEERGAVKLIEAFSKAHKLNESKKNEIIKKLSEKYGSLGEALSQVAEFGVEKLKGVLSSKLAEEFAKLCKSKVKVKKVHIREKLDLTFYGGGGLEKLKKTLLSFASLSGKNVKVDVKYLGAPHYFVDVYADDYKKAEKIFSNVREKLEAFKPSEIHYSLERVKE